MNYNRIILVGRLTRDPESRVTPAGVPVTTFGLAVSRPRSSQAEASQQEQADFFNIVTFRSTAEFVANYLTKGRLVLVEGKLQTREYTNRDGQQVKTVEIIADNVQFMEKRPDTEGAGDEGGYAASAQSRGGYDQGNQGGGRQAPAPAQSRGGYDRNAAPAQNRGGRQAAPQNNLGDDFDDPFAGE
jgi:single-strand DNA-binding protein